jgi:hypothetical protein
MARGRTFQAMFENIEVWSRIVRRLLADASLQDEDRQKRFVEEAFLDIKQRVGDSAALDYTKAGGLNYSWQGLARYWKKKTTK